MRLGFSVCVACTCVTVTTTLLPSCADANKAHRIEQLEATVERLESLLNEIVLPSCEHHQTPLLCASDTSPDA